MAVTRASPSFSTCLYLSHKAVHDKSTRAARPQGRYADQPFPIPETEPDTAANDSGQPMWVYNQRNSWHGVACPYHGTRESEGGIERLYERYTEALLAVDESVGRVVTYLEENGLANNTFVLYAGDNGFLWGEHGLIDKRNAYEESMRIPMIAWGAPFLESGASVDAVVANIDAAPTSLELAGVPGPAEMDGRSFLRSLRTAACRKPSGASRCSTSTTGNGTCLTRLPSLRYVRRATSSSSNTGSGIGRSCTTSSTTRRSSAI